MVRQAQDETIASYTNSLIDLFNTNASIVRDLAKAVAESAPNANVLVISNPVCGFFWRSFSSTEYVC